MCECLCVSGMRICVYVCVVYGGPVCMHGVCIMVMCGVGFRVVHK